MTSNDPHDVELARTMADDESVRKASRAFFDSTARYRYSYNWTWLGRPIIQYPQDIIALQEIIWRTRPSTIVETGVAHGGSTVFFASLLELLGEAGVVVAVDVDIRAHNRAALDAHPLRRRIELIEGSSIDPAIVARVRSSVKAGPVLVVLDSDHTKEHVLGELYAYAPLVTLGSYIVVMDTVIEHMEDGAFPDRKWRRGDNPLVAVREFLARTDKFEIDREIEDKLLITAAPSGYLRRIKD